MESFRSARSDGRGIAYMEDTEFSHPGLQMTRDGEALRILLPVKNDRYRGLLHLVWLGIWLTVEIALVAAVLGWRPFPSPPTGVLIGFLAVFTMAGAYEAYRLLWYTTGRETFVVTRDRLALRREIAGLGRTRIFERGSIRSIRGRRLTYGVIYPSWGRMFIGHGEGEIHLMEISGNSYSYGKGLEIEEARILSGLLLQEMDVRFQNRRRPTELRST